MLTIEFDDGDRVEFDGTTIVSWPETVEFEVVRAVVQDSGQARVTPVGPFLPFGTVEAMWVWVLQARRELGLSVTVAVGEPPVIDFGPEPPDGAVL